MLLPKWFSYWGIILVKRQLAAWSLIYFLNYAYFDINPSLLTFETPSMRCRTKLWMTRNVLSLSRWTAASHTAQGWARWYGTIAASMRTHVALLLGGGHGGVIVLVVLVTLGARRRHWGHWGLTRWWRGYLKSKIEMSIFIFNNSSTSTVHVIELIKRGMIVSKGLWVWGIKLWRTTTLQFWCGPVWCCCWA